MEEIICECGHTQYDHTAEEGCLNKTSGTLCECLKSRYDFPSQADENDELDALRSLLSDAMKALESTQADLNKFKEVCGDNDLIVPMWVNNQIENLAILVARIKVTLTGGE